MSRRAALFSVAATVTAAGVLTGLGGCEAEPSAPESVAEPLLDPLTPVLLGQLALLDSYEQVMTAYAEFAATLSDLRDQAEAHTEALIAAAPVAAAQVGVSETPSASPSEPAPPPPDPASARSALSTAVDVAAGALSAAALRADGDLAALLGSCAASTACHARLLAS